MQSEALYDISELSDLSGLTVRTIRYYLHQKLLPSPGQTGPGARYSLGHLARLRLIRELQREHLPLAEIRRRIEALGDEEVTALLEQPRRAREQANSAVDYVKSVLEPGPAYPHRTALQTAAPRPPVARERSQWERIPVADDIEVHVRRPLSRADNRRLERLLEAARRIFEEAP